MFRLRSACGFAVCAILVLLLLTHENAVVAQSTADTTQANTVTEDTSTAALSTDTTATEFTGSTETDTVAPVTPRCPSDQVPFADGCISSHTHSALLISALVFAVVSFIILFIILVYLLCWMRRRRRRAARERMKRGRPHPAPPRGAGPADPNYVKVNMTHRQPVMKMAPLRERAEPKLKLAVKKRTKHSLDFDLESD